MELVLKTSELKGSVGSNPTASASFLSQLRLKELLVSTMPDLKKALAQPVMLQRSSG